jgi:deoxyadenosine/deoxycytidine kinase
MELLLAVFFVLWLEFLIYLYNDYFNNDNRKKSKIIIIDGSIGVGKSTLIKQLVNFLKIKGYKVFSEEELILQDRFLLDFYYSDIKGGSMEEYSFQLQDRLILYYKYYYEKIKNIRNDYDYIILDRSLCSTKIFIELNIKDTKQINFLNEEINKINFQYDFAFFISSSIDIMIERQRKRSRENEENISEEYLKKVYNLFEQNYKNLYPNCISLNTDCEIYEYYEIINSIFQFIK